MFGKMNGFCANYLILVNRLLVSTSRIFNKECKAIFFDLFETLITEWGHEKYTKNQMCKDLGIVRNEFDPLWRKIEHDRYLGYISFEDAIKYVCEKCNKSIDDFT